MKCRETWGGKERKNQGPFSGRGRMQKLTRKNLRSGEGFQGVETEGGEQVSSISVVVVPNVLEQRKVKITNKGGSQNRHRLVNPRDSPGVRGGCPTKKKTGQRFGK